MPYRLRNSSPWIANRRIRSEPSEATAAMFPATDRALHCLPAVTRPGAPSPLVREENDQQHEQNSNAWNHIFTSQTIPRLAPRVKLIAHTSEPEKCEDPHTTREKGVLTVRPRVWR